MKPIIELSDTNRFVVWESGFWNQDKNFGTGVLVAGPNGEELPVIFDRDPTKGLKHGLMLAEVGGFLVGAFVRVTDKTFVQIEVMKISGLNTPVVGGEITPKADTKNLYIGRMTIPPDTSLNEQQISKILAKLPKMAELPQAKRLVKLAIKKALTPLDEQGIFYGIPRQGSQTGRPKNYPED